MPGSPPVVRLRRSYAHSTRPPPRLYSAGMEPDAPPVRPELAALLAACLAAPDDNTPRLVLADWLDEQDSRRDARLAAHVRAQVASPHRVERARAELRALFPALVRADKDFDGEMARG